MTMRSKGNSKIIGAAIAPMTALPSWAFWLSERPIYKMPKKSAIMHTTVTGKMGSDGLEWTTCSCTS